MQDGDNSFVFYRSFREAIGVMTDPADQLASLLAIIDYGLYREIPADIDGPPKMALLFAMPNIDSAKRNRKNGAKGGRAKKPSVSEGENHGFNCAETDVDVDEDKDEDKDVHEAGAGEREGAGEGPPPTTPEVQALLDIVKRRKAEIDFDRRSGDQH